MPEHIRHPRLDPNHENGQPPDPADPSAHTDPDAPCLDHRSTGPTSAAGKARSSKNALRHGLYSADPLLPDEDPELYELFVMGFYDSLDPGPGVETVLAHRLADTAWRLRRASGAEIDVYKPDRRPADLPAGLSAGFSAEVSTKAEAPAKEEAPQALEVPALPPDASPGQVYLHRLRTGGDPFRGLSRHAERLHRQFCRDLVSFHTLRRMRLEREVESARAQPHNPYRDRFDKYGERISRYSCRPDHYRLWTLEVELGLHDHDGNLPDPQDT